ncbi:hypothetical protein RND71_003653 [Anisodus tanguticus]|uniref:Uncharacterized protein n=1 Tax=Anisodus tanguticus TaxID=243964 RepID=A0AAE1SY99_9SOLA|nr:hypothetical protein RND71_003653 [Anisodus tanguticus]
MLLASPCVLSACSPDKVIFNYLSTLNHATLPLSLYRFPPDQFGLDLPFDPGSSFLTTFLGTTRYYSIMVVDDVKEILRILARYTDSASNNQFILNQFPFDPGAYMLIVSQVIKEFAERSPSSLMPLIGVVQCRLIYFGATPAATTVFVVAFASVMESGNSKADQVFGPMSNGVCKVFNAMPTTLLVGVLAETTKQMKIVQQCHFKDHADFIISSSRESEMSAVPSAQVLSSRYLDSNSLYSGSSRWKSDIAAFEDLYLDKISIEPTLNEDLYLGKLFLTTLGGAPMSEMYSDDLMIDFEIVKFSKGIGHAECILPFDPDVLFREQGVSRTSRAKRKQGEFFSLLVRNPLANLFLVMIGGTVMVNYIWDLGISSKTMNRNGLTETIEDTSQFNMFKLFKFNKK